jgi:hypothetical protein
VTMGNDLLSLGMVAFTAMGCAGTPDVEGTPDGSPDQLKEAYAQDEYGPHFRQAEAMSQFRTSSGDSWTYIDGGAFSADRGLKLEANAVGDYLVMQMNGQVKTSAHHFAARVFTTNSSGQFQLWTGPTALGPWTKQGDVQDAVFRGRAAFRTFDFGSMDTPGGIWVKFEIVGKNPASSGYSLTLDNFYWLD